VSNAIESKKPLWHENLNYEQIEAEAEADYEKAVYNLHEDCLCLKERNQSLTLENEKLKAINIGLDWKLSDIRQDKDDNYSAYIGKILAMNSELEALKAAAHSIICMVDGLYVSDELANRIHKFEFLYRSSNK
jgi:predicted RNase H-like nuclease (RuvC/YqgF family)